ncbi:hypothetical protein SGRA_0558 [Saprospira grandis str. Lewin]|uniref:Uncharacterized protein n=1 Tax=Saprospira grandis (strain Lewin) TaxID=984262 RepID=H6KZ13_SAPGL|nr:hypothetical protein SGRA_0558 [Saprospira grandis str. Lewin]
MSILRGNYFLFFGGLSCAALRFRARRSARPIAFFALLKKLGLAFGHPYTSLGQKRFFALDLFFGSFFPFCSTRMLKLP